MVREARESDAAAIEQVIAQSMRVLRQAYQRRHGAPPPAAEPDRGPQVRLVAVREGGIHGVVTYQVGAAALHVSRLFVDPARFRTGVARELLNHLARQGAELGKQALLLHTIRETGNVGIFSRLGFAVVDEREDPSIVSPQHATLHEVRMRRELDPAG